MLYREIYEQLLSLIDQNPELSNRFQTGDFVNAINAAYKEVLGIFVNKVQMGALGYDVLEPLVTELNVSGSSVAYPSDYYSLVTVICDGKVAQIVDYSEFNRRKGNVYEQGYTFTPIASTNANGIVSQPDMTKIIYIKAPTLMTEDDIATGTNAPEINEKYHQLIVWGAAANLAQYVSSGFEDYFAAFKNKFNEALMALVGGGQQGAGQGK